MLFAFLLFLCVWLSTDNFETMSASKITKSNPRKYLKIVKNKLQNKREIYVRFLQVMTAYSAQRYIFSMLIIGFALK